jgi:hypothetical protein
VRACAEMKVEWRDLRVDFDGGTVQAVRGVSGTVPSVISRPPCPAAQSTTNAMPTDCRTDGKPYERALSCVRGASSTGAVAQGRLMAIMGSTGKKYIHIQNNTLNQRPLGIAPWFICISACL